VSPEADLSLRIEHELFIRSFFEVRPPDRMVRQLAASLKDVFFPRGSTLYEKGQPSGNVYFVITGEIALESPGEDTWDLGEHAFIGALDAGQSRPYSRTARAKTDVSALMMPFREYLDLMEDHFEFTKGSMENGARNMDLRAMELPPEHVFPRYEESAPIVPFEKHPLELMDRLLVLRHSDLFGQGPVQPLVSLAKYTESEHWKAGDILFRAGEPAPHIRMVVGGRIDIDLEKHKLKGAFGPGKVLRQSAFAYDIQNYTARAGVESVTMRISKEDFFDVMEDHFSLVGSVFRYLGRENERIRTLTAELNRMKTGDLQRG
jgi:CRP-like cAMP-binding protein